ncbi:MAG: GAF domain-containing protein [Candidatus Sulfotelmatobacter sp.]|jgi:hypothetical protein
MDHQSTVETGLASRAQGDLPGTDPTRTSPPSVSAKIDAANSHQPKSAGSRLRFPGEDNGRSLAIMAYRDLDAALQLLAERAQYITGATGAMIALRRAEHNDMLCRASTGSNAPELGALLSMEHGFSGESVRTRQALRCDDAERDQRVNREGCRQLGIASVVVMPVVSDQQVLGVFELFSAKPHAFGERDLSALQRLSEMVETAVKYAVAAHAAPVALEQPAVREEPPLADEIKLEVETVTSAIPVPPDLVSAPTDTARELPQPEVEVEKVEVVATELRQTEVEKIELKTTELEKTEPQKAALQEAAPQQAAPPPTEVLPAPLPSAGLATAPEPAPKKQSFWSAATQAPLVPAPAAESTPVPAILRNLQKCQACGFPVSQGRTFCVECEDKQWRGQRVQTPAGAARPVPPQPPVTPAVVDASKDSPLQNAPSAQASVAKPSTPIKEPTTGQSPASAAQTSAPSSAKASTLISANQPTKPNQTSAPDHSTLFLSATVNSESWFAANKYILGALLLVAIVIAAVTLLR